MLQRVSSGRETFSHLIAGESGRADRAQEGHELLTDLG